MDPRLSEIAQTGTGPFMALFKVASIKWWRAQDFLESGYCGGTVVYHQSATETIRRIVSFVGDRNPGHAIFWCLRDRFMLIENPFARAIEVANACGLRKGIFPFPRVGGPVRVVFGRDRSGYYYSKPFPSLEEALPAARKAYEDLRVYDLVEDDPADVFFADAGD